MIITCENCKAKYVVARPMIGETGRNVKCVKCNHVWFAAPSPEDNLDLKDLTTPKPQASTTTPKVDGIKAERSERIRKPELPAVIESPTLKVVQSSTVLFMLLGMILGGYYLIDTYKVFEPLRPFVALNLDQSIQIVNAKITKDVVAHPISIEAKATIMNKSSEDRNLPKIRLQIKDHDHNIIGSFISDKDVAVLRPGESYNFSDHITDIPDQSAYLTIDIGTALDFVVR